jgi:hypothetical protein
MVMAKALPYIGPPRRQLSCSGPVWLQLLLLLLLLLLVPLHLHLRLRSAPPWQQASLER